MNENLTASQTATCAHCGVDIENEPNVGWVDSQSGDDGGTYDVCTSNPKGHAPAPGRHRKDD